MIPNNPNVESSSLQCTEYPISGCEIHATNVLKNNSSKHLKIKTLV